MASYFADFTVVLLLVCVQSAQHIPPYVKQCSMKDPNMIRCFIGALNHLAPFLAKGISEIEMPSIEPFQMDELSLSISSGPQGYKVTLKEIDVYGASNYTVYKMKLSDGNKPFEGRLKIPELRINARYTSSGVLLILPARGNGTFHANFGDIDATVRGKISSHRKQEKDYLHVDELNIGLNVSTVRMHVKKVFNQNRILTEATNLFLQENGHEVLQVMMPQLIGKLTDLFMGIANNLLTHVPTDVFLTP